MYLRVLTLAVCLVLAAGTGNSGVAQDAQQPANILVLGSWNHTLPWQKSFERGVVSALRASDGKHRIFYEYLDAMRLSATGLQETLRLHLIAKFGNKKIAAVIVQGLPAARFLTAHPDMFPTAKRIYPGVNIPIGDSLAIPIDNDYGPAIDEMVRLASPKKVFVVTDTLKNIGSKRLREFNHALASKQVNFDTEYLTNLAMNDLLDRVSRLPPESAIFYLLIAKDRDGREFVPFNVAKSLSARANAPVFTQWEALLGSGVVGGYLLSGERLGQMSGNAAIDLLRGTIPSIDPREAHGYYYDWRQMRRWGWGSDRDSVPPGSQIRFYEPTILEAYKWEAIMGTALMSLLIAMSVVLVGINASRRLAISALETERGLLENRVDARTTELRESEERFRSTFENMTLGCIVVDESGLIEMINPMAQRFFDYTPEESVGRNISVLMPNSDWCRDYVGSQQGPDGGATTESNREATGLRKDGDIFPIQISVGAIELPNKRAFVATVSDLSDLKLLENKLMQSQRMEAIGQLTGGIAHDFNNVMTAIAGNADLIKGSGVSEEVHRFADGALRAVDRGASLTQRLLAFSRQQALSPVSANIQDLVDGLRDLLERTLGETIALKFEFFSDLRKANVDPSQFENALINLVLNARDAMPDGGTLNIEVSNSTLDETYTREHEELAPGDYIMIAVSDNGIGMSGEIVDRVFEPFFTTKEVGLGSGLGLSMVYGFVKQSRGHINVYSELGTGTTIRLYLPTFDGTEPEAAGSETTSQTQGLTGKILAVEDDADALATAVAILRRQGHEVFEAMNGKQALNQLANHGPFDILFTDVVLPGGMNGVAIATEASKLQPGIKTLFTSGYTENAIIHNGMLDEGVVLLNKPYRSNELLSLIQALLDD